LTAIPGNSAATLSWVAPTNNGGRVVTNYKIEYSANSGSTWTTYSKPVSPDTSISLTGLTNTVSYIFRVSAINSVGTGAPSSVSSSITPSAARPSIVRNLAQTRGNLSVTLTWAVPELGSPFTGYAIEYSINNGITWTSYSNPTINNNGDSDHKITILTGLLNEPRYLFRVKAQNSSGYGAYSTIDSTGTDPYSPVTDGNEDTTSIWDFGKITFTGVCS
jgi:titin